MTLKNYSLTLYTINININTSTKATSIGIRPPPHTLPHTLPSIHVTPVPTVETLDTSLLPLILSTETPVHPIESQTPQIFLSPTTKPFHPTYITPTPFNPRCPRRPYC